MNNFDGAMQEVLKNTRYDRLTGRAVDFKQVISDAVQRFIRFLLEKFNLKLPDFSGYNTDWIIYSFITVAVVVLLVVAAVIIRLVLRRQKRQAVYDLSDIFEDIIKKQYTLDELLHMSQRAAETGESRQAVRYRYAAVLVGLSEKRIIRIEPFKTNAQLLLEITSAAPAIAHYFSDIIDCFHQVWFGYKPIGTELFALFVENTNALLSHADTASNPLLNPV